jgi:hypothetical protein
MQVLRSGAAPRLEGELGIYRVGIDQGAHVHRGGTATDQTETIFRTCTLGSFTGFDANEDQRQDWNLGTLDLTRTGLPRVLSDLRREGGGLCQQGLVRKRANCRS